MPMQIAICDDNQEDINILSKALYTYNESFQIKEYTNGEFFLADCLEREFLFDILFLDIYMPTMNGIEIATKIRAVMKDVLIIFITSSNEHYLEAFDVFAFNYIIKPLKKEKLNILLEHAVMQIAKEQDYQIQFSYKSKNYRIMCRDILYLESRDKIVQFHLKDKTVLRCYSKLEQILMQLPSDSFIRCHQSFILNLYHINEMEEKYFRIGSSVINISKKYRKTSKDKYFDYLFAHMQSDV